MKVSLKTTTNINNKKSPSFKGFYNSKALLKSLEFASDNCSLFNTTVAAAFSVVRPLSIILTPKTDKENKKISCIKAIASSIAGYLVMAVCSKPIADSVKKINKNAKNYLKDSTIENLKNGSSELTKSGAYAFSTKIFKLGQSLLLSAPKSVVTCALIPFIMSAFVNKQLKKQENKQESKPIGSKIVSFKGLYDKTTEQIAKGIGKIIDTKIIQKLSKKYYATNYEQHMMNITDIALTASFIRRNNKQKDLSKNNKKMLNYSSAYSTALSIVGGYLANSLLEKPTESFLKKFTEANKNSPKLHTYLDGIRVAKPTLILGIMYYVFIPIISTFWADKNVSNRKS